MKMNELEAYKQAYEGLYNDVARMLTYNLVNEVSTPHQLLVKWDKIRYINHKPIQKYNNSKKN